MSGPIEALLQTLTERANLCGYDLQADMRFFTERAALSGFPSPGKISAGGTCRILKARDCFLAVNLAREDDVELLPAWTGKPVGDDGWAVLEEVVRNKSAHAFAARGQMLGLPVAAIKSRTAPALQKGLPVRFRRMTRRTARRSDGPPLVLDFSSLWAGPLCAHLLTMAGARVIKVESTSRPDGARRGNEDFFDLLHAGQESLALDFREQTARDALIRLMKRADIIIEASRPRAFMQMGFLPEAIFPENPHLIWASITAYGRTGRHANRIGFGDDIAAASGLVAHEEDGPHFLGDAIADPLAGIATAAALFTALSEGGSILIDADMSRIAAHIADMPDDMRQHYTTLLNRRETRIPSGKAAAMGADTDKILRAFA